MRRPRKEVTELHLWDFVFVRDLTLLLAIFFLAWFVIVLRDIFLPVFLALVLADAFNPAITFPEKHWGWPRPLTISLLLAIVIAVFFAFFVWFAPLLFGQFSDLVAKLPGYWKALEERYPVGPGNLGGQAKTWLENFGKEPQQFLANLFSTTGRALGILKSTMGLAASISVSFLLVIISFFFFAWHFNSGLEQLLAYFPESRKQRVCEIAAKMDKAVGNFFRGRLAIAFVVGVLLSVGWFFVGVPYWFLLGMVTGFLNIFPYLAVVGWPIAILLKYADALGANPNPDLLSVIIWPSVVYIIIQSLDGWILTPWIQSQETNLTAAPILIVVFIGGAVAGMWGLLLAIPVAACVKIVLDEVFFPRLKRWAATH